MRESVIKAPFVPAIAVMNRLSFARKFALIGALTSAPLAILAFLQYSSATERIELRARERLGLAYLAPLSAFLHQLQRYRIASAAPDGMAEMSERRVLADREAARVAEADRLLGATLQTTAVWQEIANRWEALKAGGPEPRGHADADYEALSAAVVDMILHQVGNGSNLILDPDLDSYWLMDSLVNKLPTLGQATSRATARMLSAGDAGTGRVGDRLSLAGDYRLALTTADDLVRVDLTTAFRALRARGQVSALEEALARPLEALRRAVDGHAALVRDVSEVRPGATHPTADAVLRAGDEVLAASAELRERIIPALDALVETRVAAHGSRRLQGVGAALGVALILTYLLLAIYFSVRRSMLAIEDPGAPLRRGAATSGSRDEVGVLAAAYTHARGETDRLEQQLRLADRLATIGTLAAGTAHELNEPLGAVLGFAQLASKAPGLPESAAKDLDRIAKAALHAREVIKQLMLFARQTPPNKTAVDLRQVVEEALVFLAGRCQEAGIAVVRRFESVPGIVADASQLRQVVLNLMVNALQATSRGGEVRISLQTAGHVVRLAVEDDGVGMTDEIREKIFLPFYTTKDIGQGTGLGLSVVHGIVTSHGGDIRVESAPGRGTRFEVDLPFNDSGARN